MLCVFKFHEYSSTPWLKRDVFREVMYESIVFAYLSCDVFVTVASTVPRRWMKRVIYMYVLQCHTLIELVTDNPAARIS